MDMLLEQFKVLFDRPEKVKKLRELILQLAVRGKLVPQDENDEPASVLLERIKEEKERLVKEGKIKKEKPLPEIREDEKPYELPEGWEWCRLGEYTILNPRNNLNDDMEVSFIPMKLIDDGFSNKHTSESKVWSEIKSGFTHFAEDDIVVAKITPCFENRKSAVMKNLINGHGAGTTELYVIRSISGLIMPEFILSIFKTELFIQGGVDTYTGTAGQQRVKKDYINGLILGVPPLMEQKRIVQKVDSLMNFCDKLEKELDRKVKYSSFSSKSIFNSIGNCSSSQELEETLRFIIENFKDLTLGDDAVKEFKNAILQLAAQGKLVAQDPSDEPASVLLEKIQKEKEKLISEGKIKREKPLPEIREDEKLFELPDGWEWCRLGEYTILNPRNNLNDDMEVSFIPMKLIDDGFSNKHTSEVKVWGEIKSGFTHFAEGDVVVAKITPCFENRKSAVMKSLSNGYGTGTTELYVVRSILGLIRPEFILSIFKTESFIKGGVDTYTGTAGQQRVKKDYINELVIGVPPLKEQNRIIEKVDSLMTLCDELEKRIEKSKKYSEKLMEAALRDTFKA
jgi:type I restriction enzyme S subunit